MDAPLPPPREARRGAVVYTKGAPFIYSRIYGDGMCWIADFALDRALMIALTAAVAAARLCRTA